MLNGEDEDCEICGEQAVTAVIKEHGFTVRCCDDCKEIATDKLHDVVISHFGQRGRPYA